MGGKLFKFKVADSSACFCLQNVEHTNPILAVLIPLLIKAMYYQERAHSCLCKNLFA